MICMSGYYKSLYVCFFMLSWSLSCLGQEVENINVAEIDTVEVRSFHLTCADSWWTIDKAHHLLASAFLMAGSYHVFREERHLSDRKAMRFSIIFALSLGVAKEARDGLQEGRAARIKDFVSNLLGIGLGGLLFNAK